MVGIPDLLVVIAYFVLVCVIGVYMYRRIKESEDFSLARRNLGMPLALGTLVATQVGANTTLGCGGMSWKHGTAMIWIGIAYVIGYTIYSRFAVRLRRSNIWTAPEVLEKRYGIGTKRLSSLILVLAVCAVFGAQLLAMGIMFHLIGEPFGVSFNVSILIAGGILVAYTFVGGLWGVAYTDLIQFLIIFVLLGIILPLIVFSRISFTEMRTALDPKMFDFWTGLPFPLILGMLLTYIPAVIIDPTIWQRTMSSRNDTIAKWSPVYAGIFLLYITIAITLMSMAGRVLIPDIVTQYGTSDYAIPLLITNYLPTVVIGLGITAIMGVCMSTASSCLLIGAVLVSKDLIPSFSRKEMTQERELLFSRVTTLLIGIFGIIFALTIKGIFFILLAAYGIFLAGMFFPIIFGLFWKRATAIAAKISIIISSVVLLALHALKKPYGIEPIIPALSISLILMVGISWLTYRKENATEPVLQREE